MNVKPRVKVWLEADGEGLIGKGGAELLKAILDEGSLKAASEKLGVSYKYAWNYLRRIEDRLKTKIVASARGGSERGRTVLTETGKRLLLKYTRFSRFLDNALENPEMWEACGLSIPDKNTVPGKVKVVKVEGPAAVIKIEVGKPIEVVAAISSDSAEELDLKPGDKVTVIIKATEVMINKEEPALT
ncbi:MAG: molybdenum-dependent transcriptional regulator [Candidatus Jordarchaeales archaeon]|nr:molybdenum-dependent transcriptional regulator [Candidatus Jordarchaeia archaeon]